MQKMYAIKNTLNGKYYSPTMEGKTQWMPKSLAYTYLTYDIAAGASCNIEIDDFEIIEYQP